MLVLDTHAWLWWVDSPDRLGSAARDAIDQAETMGVSPISCWEVSTLARSGQIRFDRAPAAWIRQAMASPRCRPVELSPEIAVAAGQLDDSFPGDAADRLIYATAIASGAELVTRNKALRKFDPARTVWD